tara:strand:+ start:203 stop:1210 length:1008 start_codon:yes stop_codon:yes gene_type:complete
MYLLESLDNIVDKSVITDLRNFLKESKWNYKVPGGLGTNYPQRFVNTYGDGRYVTNKGNLKGSYWSSTYWTAQQTQNNISLETKTESLPKELCNIIPNLRDYLYKKFPINSMSKYTFNIAVCNQYNEPSMNISGHTDDDYWYPKEIENRPMFVSLSFYLDGTPVRDCHYSRFQIKINDKWTDIKLDDNSVLFMSSDIPHRVLSYKKKDYKYFKPRINITLRSTYSIHKNPLLHNICVANHSRYYRCPYALISNPDIDNQKLIDVLDNYNKFCSDNNYPLIISKQSKEHSTITKKKCIDLYKNFILKYNLDNIVYFKSNMVVETLYCVIEYLKKLK